MRKSIWPNDTLYVLARKALQQAGAELTAFVPKDAALWGLKSGMDLTDFYIEILGALAKYESGFKPESWYTEDFTDGDGKLVISRGLLQLSIESVNQKAYGGPHVKKAAELFDPETNLRIGVKIMAYWIKKHGVISGGKSGDWLGMARYWSQYRKPKRLEEMRAMVKKVLSTEGVTEMKKIVKTIPKYGDYSDDVKVLQEAIGADPDKWFGDETRTKLAKFQKSKGLRGTGILPKDGGQTLKLLGIAFMPPQEDKLITVPVISENFFGAPWVGVSLKFLGRVETDKEMNAWFVPEWKKEGLNYTSLAGNSRAWCSVKENFDKRAVGVSTTNSAGAASWSKYGRKCPFWFGCTLDIKHKSGGRHVATFLYWINESKKIAAVYGGNQGNKLSIVALDLSGKGDTLVAGPRWPKEVADGQFVTMAQVLAKYPILKVGGSAGSTR